MPRNPETLAFAARLREAVGRLPKQVRGPADLAVQFNLHHCAAPVTNQAVQKWWVGDSLPSPEKMQTLASMCGVPVVWLRHGIPTPRPMEIKAPAAHYLAARNLEDAEEVLLLDEFRLLSAQQKHLILEMARHLALDRKIWAPLPSE